jgi:hypothetical protein
MAARQRKMDLVFVVDATASQQCVLKAVAGMAEDFAFDIHAYCRQFDERYGAVAYRDPVHCPNDVHRFANRETISAWLKQIKASGGGDDPEDWVGALTAALNMEWREDSKKMIYWVTDANAHGNRFNNEGRRERHQDQEALLPPLIRRAAERRIYFTVVNVKKDNDPGCAKTMAAVKEIYESAVRGTQNPPQFKTVDFEVSWDRNALPVLRNKEDIVEWTPDVWPEEAQGKFQETLTGTLRRYWEELNRD